MPKLPLILIPGVLCDHTLWAPQVAALADVADVTVIDAHLKHERIDAVARAILDAAPDRFAVAGLSFGGYVVFELLRQAPGRIVRAALLDTSARPDLPERAAQREKDLAAVGRGRFLGVTDRMLRVFLHPDHLADDELRNRIKSMTQGIGPEAFVRQVKAVMSRPDSRPDLARIGCPTLVLCGADDRLTPPELSEEIAAGIPDARLVVVPHCGHLATVEQPQAVNAALRQWLTR